MTELTKWASRFGDDIRLCELEKKNDSTGLYQTQQRYGDGIPCYYFTNPVYHVWINDGWELSCMNYLEAEAYYERRIKEVGL